METTRLQNTRNNAATQISRLIEFTFRTRNHHFKFEANVEIWKTTEICQGRDTEKVKNESTTHNSREKKAQTHQRVISNECRAKNLHLKHEHANTAGARRHQRREQMYEIEKLNTYVEQSIETRDNEQLGQ